MNNNARNDDTTQPPKTLRSVVTDLAWTLEHLYDDTSVVTSAEDWNALFEMAMKGGNHLCAAALMVMKLINESRLGEAATVLEAFFVTELPGLVVPRRSSEDLVERFATAVRLHGVEKGDA
jgi:hypothetical protein